MKKYYKKLDLLLTAFFESKKNMCIILSIYVGVILLISINFDQQHSLVNKYKTNNIWLTNDMVNYLNRYKVNSFITNGFKYHKYEDAFMSIKPVGFGSNVIVSGASEISTFVIYQNETYELPKYNKDINIELLSYRSNYHVIKRIIIGMVFIYFIIRTRSAALYAIKLNSLQSKNNRIQDYQVIREIVKKLDVYYDIAKSCARSISPPTSYLLLISPIFYYLYSHDMYEYSLLMIIMLVVPLCVFTELFLIVCKVDMFESIFTDSNFAEDEKLLKSDADEYEETFEKLGIDEINFLKKISKLENNQDSGLLRTLLELGYVVNYHSAIVADNSLILSTLINLKKIGYIHVDESVHLSSTGREIIELPVELYLFRIPYEFEKKFILALKAFKNSNPQNCMKICSVEILEGFVKWAILKIVSSKDELDEICRNNMSRHPCTLDNATLGELERILFALLKSFKNYDQNTFKQLNGIMTACKNIRNSLSHDHERKVENIKTSDYVLAYDYYHLCRIFVNILYQKLAI